MKKINLLIALSITLVIMSCNNGNKTTTAVETTDSRTTTVAEPIKTGPSLPMNMLVIYHGIKDYSLWRPGFDTDSAARQESGLSFISLEKSADKPNDIKMSFATPDMAKAKLFMIDPRLKEVMGKLGVISKPIANFYSIIRYNTENQKTGGARLEIVHKVKDFDIWLKGYDAEGIATRSENGMNDLFLGRGVDDPNLVYVVFEVTDITKAKARLANPALKKIMVDAGVVGTPAITFYNDALK
ncbi:MAG: hypothetical protein WCJ85_05600 [Chitinophagaceae bacterium]